MRLTFVGQSERDDDNISGNTSRLVNFYREPLGPGGKASHVLKGVQRTNAWAVMPKIFVRDMHVIGGKFYVLADDTLYEVTAAASKVELGATASAEGAMIFGAEDGLVCIVGDGRYWVWDGSVMSEPTPGAFNAFGSGVFLGDYVVLTEKDGRRFQWSALANAKSLPGTNFATAESTDKNILRAMSLQGRLILMKEDAIEMWALTGGSNADAFALVPGGVSEIGLKAPHLATRFVGGIAFVGNNDIAYVSGGTLPQPISTPAVNTALAQGTPTHCFSYEDEGHIFIAIRFADRPAWVYDVATQEWHERASGRDEPWRVTVTAKAFGHWHAGDAFGNVYRLARAGEDEGGDLIRTAVSSTLYNDGRSFTVPMLEFTGNMGMGDLTGTPSLMLRMSRDGGRTWGRERSRSLGALGEYARTCEFRALGWFKKQACAEVRLSDARDIALDAAANVEVA